MKVNRYLRKEMYSVRRIAAIWLSLLISVVVFATVALIGNSVLKNQNLVLVAALLLSLPIALVPHYKKVIPNKTRIDGRRKMAPRFAQFRRTEPKPSRVKAIVDFLFFLVGIAVVVVVIIMLVDSFLTAISSPVVQIITMIVILFVAVFLILNLKSLKSYWSILEETIEFLISNLFTKNR